MEDSHAHGIPRAFSVVFACTLSALMILWAALGLRNVEATAVPTSLRISICNDGIVSPGEVCDMGAGNNIGSYGSSTAQRVCAPGCNSYGPYCGDGILQARFGEQCDDGNSDNNDLCDTSCHTIPPAPPPGAPSRGSTPDIPGAIPGVVSADLQTRVVLKGKAFPLSSVKILRDGAPVDVVRTDANADFIYTSGQLTPGTATFGFVGTDRANAQSFTTSVVFEIVQSAVTTVENIFLPPTISVSSTHVTPGDPLTISGFTVPRATVTIDLQDSSKATLSAKADDTGAWALQVDTASLATGFHAIKAAFMLTPFIKSGFGKAVNVYIGRDIPSGASSPDLNGDGKVNLIDFSIFLISWNTSDVRTDFNHDGTTNLADFSIMLFDWTG